MASCDHCDEIICSVNIALGVGFNSSINYISQLVKNASFTNRVGAVQALTYHLNFHIIIKLIRSACISFDNNNYHTVRRTNPVCQSSGVGIKPVSLWMPESEFPLPS